MKDVIDVSVPVTPLKVRIGAGDSAVDVHWSDADLVWRVSARSDADPTLWFEVRGGSRSEKGYGAAVEAGAELEALLQRVSRFEAEVAGARRAAEEFVAARRRAT